MLPRRVRLILMLLMALATPAVASAQNPIPAQLGNLGQGSVPLDGPWQFHLGDDPAWALPGYDDSHWEQLTADQPWGKRGHENYTGFAWCRRRVTMPETAGHPTRT